jgi:hypothetical protein
VKGNSTKRIKDKYNAAELSCNIPFILESFNQGQKSTGVIQKKDVIRVMVLIKKTEK